MTKQTAPRGRGGASARGRGTDRANEDTSTHSTQQNARTNQTAPRGRGGASARGRGADRSNGHTPTDSTEQRPPRTKQTARCSRGAASSSPRESNGSRTPGNPADSEEKPKRLKQTARCSRGAAYTRGRPSTAGYMERDDADPGPSYHRSPELTPGPSFPTDRQPPTGPAGPLGPVGLINGEYEIRSEDLDQWPDLYPEEDFNLILCLAGDSVWGAYDFGMFCGIIYLPERPYRASYDRIPLQWRGRGEGRDADEFWTGQRGLDSVLWQRQDRGRDQCLRAGAILGTQD